MGFKRRRESASTEVAAVRRRETENAPTLWCPSLLLGAYKDASSAAGKLVTKLMRGASIEECVAGQLIPVDAHPKALIVVSRSWSMIDAARPQFHLDRPWRILSNRVHWTDKSFDRIRRDVLRHSWSLLGVAASEEYEFVRHAQWQLEMVYAAVEHWPAIASTGPRFTTGGFPVDMDEVHWGLVAYSLARQGADVAGKRITAALLRDESERLPGLRIRRALEAGDVAAAVGLLEAHDHPIVVLSLAEHFLHFGLDARVADVVTRLNLNDPHGHVTRWLARTGDQTRVVQ